MENKDTCPFAVEFPASDLDARLGATDDNHIIGGGDELARLEYFEIESSR